MDKESVWTSTGIKLLYHPEVVKKVIKQGAGSPISVQIAPTSRCQLNCSFCSNANREKHEDIDHDLIIETLYCLHGIGLRTVEWTGGGDPTMHKDIDSFIMAAYILGLDQGFITNGIALKDISRSILSKLKWVRISMNCLDYVSDIEIPKIDGALGFSYVMNNNTTPETLNRLDEYVKKYNPKYVRIVPNCQATYEEQVKNNAELSEVVARWGSPYFYQAKNFCCPERCWWGYFKPFILHDGYVYPCSSVVLNEDSDKTFHSKYRWVKVQDIMNLYENPMQSFPTSNCSHCVFTNQNNMIDSLLTYTGMENFI